jgi:hypothetical protein
MNQSGKTPRAASSVKLLANPDTSKTGSSGLIDLIARTTSAPANSGITKSVNTRSVAWG